MYRARDTRLNREVALKILPSAFSEDPDRLARFAREAQTLALLNHPNIAQIYGLEESAAGRVLVMELVEGETLADRIARTNGRGIPLEEAISIARQIADAVEAAHDRGIVHRDLKPANVKIRPDAMVKVLDFGLAKALQRTEAPEHAESPTLTAEATQAGVILGTAAYMAPEQATGKQVDKRADIWAFGCVLFEMLTGRRAFKGDSVSEILAAVLRDAPSLERLPPTTPSAVRRLLDRCLQRDPAKRLRDIGDARLELDSAGTEPVVAATRRTRSISGAVAISATLAAGLAAGAVWLLKPDASPPLRKLELALPATGVALGSVQLSPDGTRVAYVAGDHLFVRRLDDLDPQDLGSVPPGTEVLAWSADATTIAFASTDGKIRKIAATRGQPLVVSDLPDTRRAIGLVWLGNNIIAAVWRSGLYRVDARGGTMARWLDLNAATEVDFHALASLPDGRVVFATHRQNNEYPIESFDGTNRVLLHSPTLVGGLAYSPTGHLLVVKGGLNPGLWAMRFRRDGLDADNALHLAPEAEVISASADATILFAATHSRDNAFELVAVNRAGQDARVLKAFAPLISSPTVSPDGRRLVHVLGAQDRTNMPTGLSKRSVWVHQLEPPADIRLTPEDGDFGLPAWSSSGDRVLISEALSPVGRYRLIALALDGSGARQQLADGCCAQLTPDGRRLLFAHEDRGTLRLRHAALGATGLTETPQRVFPSDPEPRGVLLRSIRALTERPTAGLCRCERLWYFDTSFDKISWWRRTVACGDSRRTGRHLGIAMVSEDQRIVLSED